jgi:hypothetical protein
MYDYWMIALPAALLVAVLSALAFRRQKGAIVDMDGWKTLRPSLFFHASFIICFGMGGLFLSVLFNEVSFQFDTNLRKIFTVISIVILGVAVTYPWWRDYTHSISWRAPHIRVRKAFGREWFGNFVDVLCVEEDQEEGTYRIRFKDGAIVVFSKHMHGVSEFLEQLALWKIKV